MILYQYAHDESNNLVHINEGALQAKTGIYKCISCGQEVITKRGSIKQHHFAHKAKLICNGETYLHKLGKDLFRREFLYCKSNNIPFNIELEQRGVCIKHKEQLSLECNLGLEYKKYNLASLFHSIEYEKQEGEFIPDLLLTRQGKDRIENIFIEIKVTHGCSKEKIESGKRIIEIEIKKEEDLDIIRNHSLSVFDYNINFYNFKSKVLSTTSCPIVCKEEYDLFIVTPEGKCMLSTKSVNKIAQYLHYNKVIAKAISKTGDNRAEKFKRLAALTFEKNKNVRNCYLCVHHTDSYGDYDPESRERKKPIYCKCLRTKCNSNAAASCKYYYPDMDTIKGHLDSNEDSDVDY